MRKVLALLAVTLVVFSMVAAAAPNGYIEAAPSSGDGVPDGSGFDAPSAPNGDAEPFGPAPRSGDGIPDGSGLLPPNGPNA